MCGVSFFLKTSSSLARPRRRTEATTFTSTNNHSRSARTFGRDRTLGALTLHLFSTSGVSDGSLYFLSQTSDIGMTHHSSMSTLCFEIWFRRRKREDTYTFRASSVEGKKAWTADLERILWNQAAHSRGQKSNTRTHFDFPNGPN